MNHPEYDIEEVAEEIAKELNISSEEAYSYLEKNWCDLEEKYGLMNN